MKKGLRPRARREKDPEIVRTDDLMKKGLRHQRRISLLQGDRVRTDDLMKKGLRQSKRAVSENGSRSNR